MNSDFYFKIGKFLEMNITLDYLYQLMNSIIDYNNIY